MQGIEKVYCNVCIKALVAAWRSLMETTPAEALRRVNYGKSDTFSFDAIPEIIICKRLRDFDNHAILVTEELDKVEKRRWPTDSDPALQPLMFFSDPMDRSKQLRLFLEKISSGEVINKKVGELMVECNAPKVWEEMFEAPASITGASIAISCVRKGVIVFSVILNCITRTVFVAASIGIFYLELPFFNDTDVNNVDFSYIVEHGKKLAFMQTKDVCLKSDDFKIFVTFLGKTGYRENFNDSMIFVENPDKFLHHDEPGGPARILYLSELQKQYGPIGFILANGEKITEWIHWLAFVKFAKNKEGGDMLKLFEVFIDRPWTKDGILMSTSLPYSIFSYSSEGTPFLDISRLRDFNSPSKFRSMLVVTPFDNERIIYTMQQHRYREINLFL